MRRSPRNPILTRADIPDIPPLVTDVSSVFNPGAIAVGDRTLLLLRVQTRGRETFFLLAESLDGESFRVRPEPMEIEGLEGLESRIHHAYDPRLTRVGEDAYAVFGADTDDGCHLGIARLRDESRLELVSFSAERDSRNGVLFPERIGGRYLRLERPNTRRDATGVVGGDEIWTAESEDLVSWRLGARVMSGRPRYWDELIGSGPPPLKTREGWLHLYHGVATHFAASNVYQAGVSLLDLEDPSRVIARGRNNVLEPRELYEQVGQVPNVVFPTGMIAEGLDEEGFAHSETSLRIYYGAADTCVGLAETTVGRLLEECRLE
jgi:beta-1,4-mannooligosaccharide/beta-1,4-mannosyl-N-acetylglucosamine phosphorylase